MRIIVYSLSLKSIFSCYISFWSFMLSKRQILVKLRYSSNNRDGIKKPLNSSKWYQTLMFSTSISVTMLANETQLWIFQEKPNTRLVKLTNLYEKERHFSIWRFSYFNFLVFLNYKINDWISYLRVLHLFKSKAISSNESLNICV